MSRIERTPGPRHTARSEKPRALTEARRELNGAMHDLFEPGGNPGDELANALLAVFELANAKRAPRALQAAGVGDDTQVHLASFNVLGSSHTVAGGEHPGFASGPARMHGAVQQLKKHHVDVVGFQELQANQLKTFQKETDGRFGVYPGFKLGRKETVNSIAWDKSKWELVKAHTVKVPYFNGHMRPMPVVLLRSKETGQKAFFANVHNPADTRRFHHQEAFRDRATDLETRMINRLRERTGLPVFLTGDANEQAEFGQKVTAHTGLHSAYEGAHDRQSRKLGIDWIFGSGEVRFTDFLKARSRKQQHISDHPLLVADAIIRG